MFGLLHATVFEMVGIWSVLGVAFLGLGYALFLRAQILRYRGSAEKGPGNA